MGGEVLHLNKAFESVKAMLEAIVSSASGVDVVCLLAHSMPLSRLLLYEIKHP